MVSSAAVVSSDTSGEAASSPRPSPRDSAGLRGHFLVELDSGRAPYREKLVQVLAVPGPDEEPEGGDSQGMPMHGVAEDVEAAAHRCEFRVVGSRSYIY